MGAVAEATRENFDALVESGTTLVDVYATCPPALWTQAAIAGPATPSRSPSTITFLLSNMGC